MAESLAIIWYYQTWIVAISFAAFYIKSELYAAATCVFIAYVAVTWYPLLGQVIHGR